MNDERSLPARANIPILITSLLLAVILWVVVTTQETVTTRDFPITLQYGGLSPRLTLDKQAPSESTVRVSGPAEELRDYATRSFKGYVDLSIATQPGRHQFTIGLPTELRDIAVPNGFPKMYLNVYELKTVTMTVQTGTRGRLADSSVLLDERDVNPHKVTVTGPEASVLSVKSALVTINLNEVHTDSPEYDGYIYLYDVNGKQLNERELGLTVVPPNCQVHLGFVPAPVQKPAFIVAQFKPGTHPNAGFQVDGNYTVDPVNVNITGSSIALAQTAQVKTEPIDLSGLTADHQFVVRVLLPPGVTAAAPKFVKVRVPIGPAPNAPH